MIIPVKCFTCGKVLADKYDFWQSEVRKIISQDNVIYFSKENVKKTPEAMVMDKLKITKMCCRRHMLTHVDIL